MPFSDVSPFSLGSYCTCVPDTPPSSTQPPGYRLLANGTGAIIGLLRWDARKDRYVLVPMANTAWTSRDLAEVGVWLRRLTRRQEARNA